MGRPEQRHDADEHREDRDDHRDDGAADEERGDMGRPALSCGSPRRAPTVRSPRTTTTTTRLPGMPSGGAGRGSTSAPSVAFCTPSTTMRSPSSDARGDDAQAVRRTARARPCGADTLLSGPTTATEYAPCTEMSAFSGTTSSSCRPRRGGCARARIARGARGRRGWDTSACSWMVPVLGVDLAVGRDDDALVGVDAAVGEHELDAGVGALGRAAGVELRRLLLGPGEVAPLELLEAVGVAHVVDLAQREVHADRVDLRHRREQRRAVLADEVADAHEREPGDAVDGRAELRVRQVERRRRSCGLRGAGPAPSASATLAVALSRSCCETIPVLKQPLVALELERLRVARDLRATRAARRRRHAGRVLGRLDREEQLARLDARAVLVLLRLQEPAHAGADLGVDVAVERADGLDVEGHVAA